MIYTWTSYIIVSVLTFSALSIYFWKQRRRNFQKVGKIARLFFFPVKSLRAVEVTNGKLTNLGFEVDGVLDRSFMLVDEEGVLISQRQSPSLVLLTPEIKENYLVINGSDTQPLTVEILQHPPSNAKLIKCKVHTDNIDGVDCGDEAASWFQAYLKKEGVRLVRYFPSLTLRKYPKNNPFFVKLNKDHPIGFQDLVACHVLSQASVDDLNSRIGEKKVSVYNFRPNVVVDDCKPYEEDSWAYIHTRTGVLMQNLLLTTRCIMTTNDVDEGVLSQKDPLTTLRKYRIPSDPALLKVFGSIPCFGAGCAVLVPGEITVGDEILAVVVKKIKMKEKST